MRIHIAYIVTAILLLIGSYTFDGRVWGINAWSVFAPGVTLLLASVLLAAPLLLRPLCKQSEPQQRRPKSSPPRLHYLDFVVPFGFVVASIILRERIYVLGDGYQALAFMSDPNPYFKVLEYGELVIRYFIRELFPGSLEDAALFSYRFVSIAAGLLLSLAAVAFANRQFKNRAQRVLFASVLLTNGYSYIFFGYVENYSLFVASVAAFCFVGVLAIEARISVWWALLFACLASFLHVAGVVLVGGLIFVWLTKSTAFRSRIIRQRRLFYLCLSLFLPAGLLAVAYLRNLNYFFKFALLPLISDRFTIDGYTLFAGAHLADMLNLFFLLVPSILLLAAILQVGGGKSEQPDGRTLAADFLLVQSVVCTVAIFILDPKLGMPRDWDLFAFASIPLIIWLLLKILHSNLSSPALITGLTLAILLNSSVLVARAITWSIPELGAKMYYSYLMLDRSRNRTGWKHFDSVYRAAGTPSEATKMNREWSKRFPEYEMIGRGNELGKNGRFDQAMKIYREILRINAGFAPAYANVGLLFYNQGIADSAVYYLAIADAIQPGNPQILENYAVALEAAGKSDRADQVRQSLQILRKSN